MENDELITLLINSSSGNPYGPALKGKENIIAAIELAKLFKTFADKGYNEEAMNISSEQYSDVILELKKRISLQESTNNCPSCGIENSIIYDKFDKILDDKSRSCKTISISYCEECGDVINFEIE